MARYFRLPFAVNGDKDILPDTTVNTAVSYDTGYTADYQRDPVTDPLARNPERNFFNQILFDVTDTLRLYYENGVPPFIAPSDNNNQPFLYNQGARVLFNARVYESRVGNNGTEPSNATNWQPVDIAGNDARYLLESNNLSDLTDPAAARANLSISSTPDNDARYLQESNNLSDLDNAATARTNLQLGTAAQSNVGTGPNDLITTSEADSRFDGRYLNESANLSDLPSTATARTNLDVYARAETYTRAESDAQYLNEASNLSDLPSATTARTNLGLGTAATVNTGTGASQLPTTSQADARYLLESNNLSDLTNAATARTNLELGTAAQAQVNQFIYPNSGLVGSIEKSDLFTTPATVANQFTIRARTYNINGQFVPIIQTGITLAAAELTAVRAVAFDDLFVESDGTYRHVRSINARRTTTGFNADQIATDAGYTRVSQGLYSRSGNHALLLGRITRRNQGAYESQLNPSGNAGIRNNANTETENWYQNPTAIRSQSDAFDRSGGANNPDISTGAIGQTSGRPDDLFYDGITTNDITPLYFSARAVTDRKALLFDNFNRAVAGETFSGAEGTSQERLLVDQANYTNSFEPSSATITVNNDSVVFNNTPILTNIDLLNINYPKGSRVKYSFTLSAITSGTVALIGGQSGASFVFPTGNLSSTGIYTGEFLIPDDTLVSLYFESRTEGTSATIENLFISVSEPQPSASPQFLYVDIIGALTAMPQEWLDNGIPGNWLAVDEDGGSLIPDGTAKEYKASRKVLDAYLVLQTDDRGVTWSDVTSTYETALEGTGNTLGSQTFAATRSLMVFYRTAANPFELTDNLPIIEYSVDIPKLRSQFLSDGCLLASHLFNKIPVESGQAFAPRRLLNSVTFSSTGYRFSEVLTGARKIEHPEFDGDVTTNPSVKVLGYLSNSYFVTVYKELHYNGTSFGDDNRFNIVDNQSTVTDTNGETVIVGQKRVALPYHFDGDLY